MLEVKIPGVEHYGVISADSAYRGRHLYISGFTTEGGQTIAQLKLPHTSVQAFKAQYPVNKLRMYDDLSDTSSAVDLLSDGDTVIYYEGGEYITDQFDHDSFGLDASYWAAVEAAVSTASGRRMYSNPGSATAPATTGLKKIFVGYGTNGEGKLYGSTASGRAVESLHDSAQAIGFMTGINYKDSSEAYLHYRIMPNTNTDKELIGLE